MNALPAFALVGGLYAALSFLRRRVLLVWSSRRGPELPLYATFDHAAAARELGATVAPPAGSGPAAPLRLPRPPTRAPLGELPPPWEACAFARAAGPLLPARELLEEGRDFDAVAAALSEADAAQARALMAHASLSRLFAGEVEGALLAARALASSGADDAALAASLEALALTRSAETLARGPARDRACQDALGACRRAGIGRAGASAWLLALGAHVQILSLSIWTLEIAAPLVRRLLTRAARKASDAPFVHLERAHLSAALGEGEATTEHLARALYHARGDPFYARPILQSRYVARVRPALLARARALHRGSIDTPASAVPRSSDPESP